MNYVHIIVTLEFNFRKNVHISENIYLWVDICNVVKLSYNKHPKWEETKNKGVQKKSHLKVNFAYNPYTVLYFGGSQEWLSFFLPLVYICSSTNKLECLLLWSSCFFVAPFFKAVRIYGHSSSSLALKSKLYTPSTLNIVLIQWHTHLNVCAVK